MKVAIKTSQILHIINTDEIVYMKAKGSYSIIKKINGEEIKVSKNLLNLGTEFGACTLLVKCHRSFIANITHVNLIQSENSRYYIVFSNQNTIPLSQTYQKDFINQLMKMLKIIDNYL